MLSITSPITFPPGSTGVGAKRSQPGDNEPQLPNKPRVQGGFLVDDDSDDDESGSPPPPKKRMLEANPNSLAANPISQPASDEGVSHPPLTSSTAATSQTCSVETPYSTSGTSSIWTSLSSLTSYSNYRLVTCSGKSISVTERKMEPVVTYQSMVAARSRTKEGRAKRAYYGIEIHELVDGASKELALKDSQSTDVARPVLSPSVETEAATGGKTKKSMLWTEKYRARNFMDLCGDDATNRTVLRWLKRWDPVVFPGAAKTKSMIKRRPGAMQQQGEEEKPHRKILMLTGPPGLGKTTLAHVCAKQAGYEVLEVNASDDRSRDVVKNRIRTSLGTETVKAVANTKEAEGAKPKVARPVCVIVDEVDGAVAGSGSSGEGGFVKALIDLVLLDQKNSASKDPASAHYGSRKKKNAQQDDFRLMRPLILICNDVYHPSLRPLRQSNLAEVVHVGKPSLDAVVTRLKTVFEKEGIPCDKDAARKICESAWGLTSGIDARRGAESNAEGDLRGVMVVGEWVAGRFRSTPAAAAGILTRHWLERDVLKDLEDGGGGGRGLGRGSVRDIVSRVFQEGGGFPRRAAATAAATAGPDDGTRATAREQPKTQLGFAELHKRHAMEQLRHMVDTCGDADRVVADVFTEYPAREFNDDSYLTKPNQAYEWMHFLDACSARVFRSQEWELAPYLAQPVLACHHLFASPASRSWNAAAGPGRRWGAAADDDAETPPLPFSGPRADYEAREAERQNRAQLALLQAQLRPGLARAFRGPGDVATELLPYLVRLLAPDVKPVVVGGSGEQRGTASVRRAAERRMVARAAEVLADVGVALERGKIEGDAGRGPQWVYRLEPDLDTLSAFETATATGLASQAPTRYAVRQVLDQELQKTLALRESAARQARFRAGGPAGCGDMAPHADKENRPANTGGVKLGEKAVKRDFFGRVVEEEAGEPLRERDGNGRRRRATAESKERRVWVTFHEGLNNAVRKPISLEEFMSGL